MYQREASILCYLTTLPSLSSKHYTWHPPQRVQLRLVCVSTALPGTRSTPRDEQWDKHVCVLIQYSQAPFCSSSSFWDASTQRNFEFVSLKPKKGSLNRTDWAISFVIRSRSWVARGARRHILFVGLLSLCFIACVHTFTSKSEIFWQCLLFTT